MRSTDIDRLLRAMTAVKAASIVANVACCGAVMTQNLWLGLALLLTLLLAV